MKRPADQTGFYRKLGSRQEDDSSEVILVLVVILCVLAIVWLSGCASTTPTIGECIDGRVTWSDGTISSCKILKDSGEI